MAVFFSTGAQTKNCETWNSWIRDVWRPATFASTFACGIFSRLFCRYFATLFLARSTDKLSRHSWRSLGFPPSKCYRTYKFTRYPLLSPVNIVLSYCWRSPWKQRRRAKHIYGAVKWLLFSSANYGTVEVSVNTFLFLRSTTFCCLYTPTNLLA